MAQKSLQAKVTGGDGALLRGVHEAFNRELPFLLGVLFKMKRGELGPDYKIVFDSIKKAQEAPERLEKITSRKPWNPVKKNSNIKKNNEILEQWLKDNPAYAEAKPKFNAFEKEYGDTGDKRYRDDFQRFKEENPDCKNLLRQHNKFRRLRKRIKDEWILSALKIKQSGNILFDRAKKFGVGRGIKNGYGSEFWRKMCEMSVQCIRTFEEQGKNWERDFEAWKKDKNEWETKHKDYMEKAKPLFDEFIEEHGLVRGKKSKN